jgi:hypothetical protein
MNKGMANNSRTSRLMSLQSDQRKTPTSITTEDESVTKHQWMAANKQGTLLADQIYYKSAKEFNNQVSTMTK